MTDINIAKLNEDITQFPQVFPITPDMNIAFDGVSRLVMLDRYAFKDTEKKTLAVGDFVVLTVKSDPKFPARGYGFITAIDLTNRQATVKLDESFVGLVEDATGEVVRSLDVIEKPLEVYYEQIAKRNAKGLSDIETDEAIRQQAFDDFYRELVSLNFVPGGRVIYGAGTGTDVTYFNCYVMPYPADSREGIGAHRNEVMEIMSRGGGVGTNGSSLRPRSALARGVNGKSSGSVSWLNDIAQLTHLVEQGGSRRGAQMIMLADWHPDIIEFIISKMQNPRVIRFLIETTKDDQIRRLAQEKLKFTPFTETEIKDLDSATNYYDSDPSMDADYKRTLQKLHDGGTYSVNNPDFLTGANISVALTKEFMQAVEDDANYELRFPDVENYTPEEMTFYNAHWHKYGDVREWAALGYGIKTYRTIKARELWNLVNICATYSAEPGIFFIDNANEMTNAVAYGQKVVATNPCGEQPLAPYSVCNLAAVNLANMADKATKTVDYEKLKRTVTVGIRMMDNVIDATPYFLPANKKQALGERRLGMGVMGLHDLLIYCEVEYGSPEGNAIVDKVFETMATTAYRASIELAKEKKPFPFLIADRSEGNDPYHKRKKFIESGFMRNMPEDIRQDVLAHGIRNSHVLTVAPTGTTGTMVGVSTGLEPYFAFKYYRSGRLGQFIEVNAAIVQEYLDNHPETSADKLPAFFVSSMQLAPEQHADVQCIIQRWVDSSLSKTVNAPKGYTVEQVQAVYERLYKGGAKGGTVYVDGSRDAQVLSLSAEDNVVGEAVVEQKPPLLVETINELTSTNITAGSEVGDSCPICRKGEIIDAGGCNTCNNCGVQLKCGL